MQTDSVEDVLALISPPPKKKKSVRAYEWKAKYAKEDLTCH